MQSQREQSQSELNCLIIGDSLKLDGKNISQVALLTAYRSHRDLTDLDYIPTIPEAIVIEKNVYNINVRASLDVLVGADNTVRLRPLFYTNKHVFILPFSYESHTDLDSITKRILELQHYANNALIYLVGIHSAPKMTKP